MVVAFSFNFGRVIDFGGLSNAVDGHCRAFGDFDRARFKFCAVVFPVPAVDRLVAFAIAGGAAGIAVAAAGWGGFPGALLAIGASGLLVGVASPSRDLLVRAAAPPGGIGLAFGFTATGMSVGFAAGPPAVGWLMDLGRPDLGLLMLAAVSLCAVATVSGLRPNRR